MYACIYYYKYPPPFRSQSKKLLIFIIALLNYPSCSPLFFPCFQKQCLSCQWSLHAKRVLVVEILLIIASIIKLVCTSFFADFIKYISPLILIIGISLHINLYCFTHFMMEAQRWSRACFRITQLGSGETRIQT